MITGRYTGTILILLFLVLLAFGEVVRILRTRSNGLSLATVSRASPLTVRKVGKCTYVFGDGALDYEEALNSHIRHNEMHHYSMHILKRSIVDGIWAKEATLLSLLLNEMSKPKSERLEWIVWFDADTIIANPLIPLEIFLPPEGMEHIHAMVTKDWNGLNNGVFFLRVTSWSVKMLSAVLSYPTFRPDENLPFTDQSAMALILEGPAFERGVVYVPPRWFNSYPFDAGTGDSDVRAHNGDMVLHFPGLAEKAVVIHEWLVTLSSQRELWERTVEEIGLLDHTTEFWHGVKAEVARQ